MKKTKNKNRDAQKKRTSHNPVESVLLSTATSANVGFSQVVQLLAPPQTPVSRLAEKIPFINSEKKIFWVSTMCAQILGFSRVRGRVRVRVKVRLRVRVRVRV